VRWIGWHGLILAPCGINAFCARPSVKVHATHHPVGGAPANIAAAPTAWTRTSWTVIAWELVACPAKQWVLGLLDNRVGVIQFGPDLARVSEIPAPRAKTPSHSARKNDDIVERQRKRAVIQLPTYSAKRPRFLRHRNGRRLNTALTRNTTEGDDMDLVQYGSGTPPAPTTTFS